MSDSEPETASYNSDRSDSEDEYYSDDEPNFAQEGGYPTFGGDSDSEDGDENIKPKISIGAEIKDGIVGDDLDFAGEDDEDEDEDEEEDDEDGLAEEGEDEVTEMVQDAADAPDVEDDDTDDDEEESDDEGYLRKFDREVISNYVDIYHPESRMHNYDEVRTMSVVVRDANGDVIDQLHKTLPFMTKFEKAKILGLRAKQLDEGAQPFVKAPPNAVTGYTIAVMELEQKKIPFIIRRPIPGGASEYWKVSDLEILI